jgi:hypothetical protein
MTEHWHTRHVIVVTSNTGFVTRLEVTNMRSGGFLLELGPNVDWFARIDDWYSAGNLASWPLIFVISGVVVIRQVL